jgi:hypothetical protein
LIKAGVISINEARAAEDLNAVDGGSIHTVQVNQIALNSLEDYSKKISSDGE